MLYLSFALSSVCMLFTWTVFHKCSSYFIHLCALDRCCKLFMLSSHGTVSFIVINRVKYVYTYLLPAWHEGALYKLHTFSKKKLFRIMLLTQICNVIMLVYILAGLHLFLVFSCCYYGILLTLKSGYKLLLRWLSQPQHLVSRSHFHLSWLRTCCLPC